MAPENNPENGDGQNYYATYVNAEDEDDDDEEEDQFFYENEGSCESNEYSEVSLSQDDTVKEILVLDQHNQQHKQKTFINKGGVSNNSSTEDVPPEIQHSDSAQHLVFYDALTDQDQEAEDFIKAYNPTNLNFKLSKLSLQENEDQNKENPPSPPQRKYIPCQQVQVNDKTNESRSTPNIIKTHNIQSFQSIIPNNESTESELKQSLADNKIRKEKSLQNKNIVECSQIAKDECNKKDLVNIKASRDNETILNKKGYLNEAPTSSEKQDKVPENLSCVNSMDSISKVELVENGLINSNVVSFSNDNKTKKNLSDENQDNIVIYNKVSNNNNNKVSISKPNTQTMTENKNAELVNSNQQNIKPNNISNNLLLSKNNDNNSPLTNVKDSSSPVYQNQLDIPSNSKESSNIITENVPKTQLPSTPITNAPVKSSKPNPVVEVGVIPGWVCPRCTLVNPWERPGCEACTTDRPPQNKNNQPKQKTSLIQSKKVSFYF